MPQSIRWRTAVLILPVLLAGSRAIADSQTAAPGSERLTLERQALDLAGRMAGRYPATPSMNYISGVTWAHTLRLARLLDDRALTGRVMQQVEPWLNGGTPLFGERVSLAAAAGTIVFADLAENGGGRAAARLADEGHSHAAREKAPGIPDAATGWTDDMFTATVILVRRGGAEGRAAAARLLLHYAGTLQRADGLFNHAPGSPFAWGRGNGFAALGLVEFLVRAPADDPSRAAVLDVYRRHMAAMRTHLAPDGLWRQVVDVPGSYLELSVTAMTVSAMARGLRAGWLDASYRPLVERAWRGLLTRVRDDGTLEGVCTSTGAGPTLEYYLNRPSVSGADDRGGAFVLGAALDVMDLVR